MRRNLLTLSLVVLSFAGSRTVAQDWLKAVPQKAQRELTIEDYKRAFEAHFKEHPVDLSKDKVQPTFQFEGAEEVKARMDIEEYKLFSRFLWLIEPRTYPTGKLDFEKIDAIRKELPKIDNGLVLKQQQPNPLNLKIRQNRILWPLQPFWKPLGPSDAVGGTNLGRVNAILFDPKNPKTIYIGTPDGGVWKTINFGSTWTPKFDSQPTLSVGSIVIDPNDSKILYVATSDPFGYGTPFWGGTYSVGVRKSMDGGNTWTSTGLTWTVSQNRTIRRLAIHPSNGNILLAATSDGVYRTINGGLSWKQILATSAFDVAFQPNNGNVAYVTTTQVLKSTNAGTTFNPLTASCAGSRYSIAVARTNPNVLYTLCASGAASVQKSVNAGATWTTVTAPGVSLYGYYDTVLAVSPINENDVYVAGFNIMHTTNGGSTWTSSFTAVEGLNTVQVRQTDVAGNVSTATSFSFTLDTLAPAAPGGNRTGRMFTGDRSGDFLYGALHRAGFANQPTSIRQGDGLRLSGAFITAPCRCAPPENKPLPDELLRCSSWLDREISALRNVRVVLALGSIGWGAALAHFARRGLRVPRPRPQFGHGAEGEIPGGPVLLGCYHVSQQNTNTRKLTPEMIDAVLARAKALMVRT